MERGTIRVKCLAQEQEYRDKIFYYIFVAQLTSFHLMHSPLIIEAKKPEEEPTGLQITKELEDVEVDEGESATLEMCFVSDTKPTVAWFKDMKPMEQTRRVKIVTDENSSKMVIKKTVGEDEGLYKCSLQSSDRELSSSAELIVEGMQNCVG